MRKTIPVFKTDEEAEAFVDTADLSEYDPADLKEVPGLKLPDGSPAKLYSAYRKGPVLLHTKWMRQYEIDGVFLSRFVGEAASRDRSNHVNTVLANVREGCHREGRVWAMMLDLSMGKRVDGTEVAVGIVRAHQLRHGLHGRGCRGDRTFGTVRLGSAAAELCQRSHRGEGAPYLAGRIHLVHARRRGSSRHHQGVRPCRTT